VTFRNYLKDQISLLLLWLLLVLLAALFFWLTPQAAVDAGNMLYLFLLGTTLMLLYLALRYIQQKNWWQQLELDDTDAADIAPQLKGARSAEKQLFQDYVNQLLTEQQAALNRLENASNEQRDYIDGWVHDIKVPLASLNLLLEDIEPDISETRFNQLQETIQHIDDYVEQVMYYSRLDSFSRDYLIRSYSLKKIVQKAVRHSSHYFIQKNLQFNLLGDDYDVLTDEKWLSFILHQLINNAIKYTADGGSITIALSKNERGVWLSVADTGIGIPREDLRRVFDKGFTGYNGRFAETSSTGLGLYLAKSLLQKMGHRITVDSEVGKGTTFQILFPPLAYYAETDEIFMLK